MVVVVVAVVALTSGGSSPSSTSSTSPDSAAGVRSGEYAGTGQNIQHIAFTVDGSGHTVSELHGTFAVSCASSGGSSYQLQTFTDPNRINMSGGTFSDQYKFATAGGPQATLTVNGTISGATATGHLQFAEPYCGTPLDGWSAAMPGHTLPPVPQYSAPDSTACSPQPCSVLGGVVLHIDAVRVVTEADGSNARGIDVGFSVRNGSSEPVSVSDANFALTPQGGTKLYSSYAGFVDSGGQQVGCLHGNVPLLAPGQSETQQHACFLPPADQIGQPLTLSWDLVGSGSASLAIGTAAQ